MNGIPVLTVTHFDQLAALRSGGKVRRYHTSDVSHVENNAEHSFGVALLCMTFWPTKAGPGLLRAALLHDLQEFHVGDLPHTVKRDNPALHALYAEAEAVACKDMGTFDVMIALTEEEHVMLKAADVADAFMYGRDEYNRGNRAVGRQIMRNSIIAFQKYPGVLPHWFVSHAIRLDAILGEQ